MDPGSQPGAPLPTGFPSALLNLSLEGKLNSDSLVGIPRGTTHLRNTVLQAEQAGNQTSGGHLELFLHTCL